MTVNIEKFTISSKGFDDLIDITTKVQDIIYKINKKDVVVSIAVASPTASIITIGDETGLGADFSELLDNIVPLNKIYKHDTNWHEGNAHAHLKASLSGSNLTISAIDNKLVLDNNQKIAFIDFDSKPSITQITVSVIY